MAWQNLDQLLQSALQHHQAGQLQQAESLYREVLKREQNQPDALHLLGMLAMSVGRYDAAVELTRRALSVRPMWPDAAYNLGIALKGAGRLDEAIAAYRNAIALRPNHPESHFNLAAALQEKGDINGAVAGYQKVVQLDPRVFEAHYQLGTLLTEAGLSEPAINALATAVVLQPGHAQAWLKLGVAYHRQGKLKDANAAYQQAIALEPGNAHAHNNQGAVLRELKLAKESIAACSRAIELDPGFAEAHANLASAFKAAGRIKEAEAAYHRAIALNPALAMVYCNLGAMLADQARNEEALVYLRKAIALNPRLGDAHNSMGNALRELGRLDESFVHCKIAIELTPEFVGAWNSIASTNKDSARLDEAIAGYRQAIIVDPANFGFHSNLLLMLNYLPSYDPQTAADEHRQWNHVHAEPLRKFIQPLSNDRDPDRRLRIGYVSSDFRVHAVCKFALPLIAGHSHELFEIFCYSGTGGPDEMTRMVRDKADVWREISDLSDEETAALIREDRIDILIDLTGHTGGQHLKVFAQKPAPVQVTYLGYPGTTGLRTIDYRLSDEWADPPGMTDSLHSERLFRLSRSAWCFEEPTDPTPPREPLSPNHAITFGCFNNATKINEPLIQLWAQIVQQVPGAKLLLKASALGADSVRQRFSRMALDAGIAPDRLQLLPGVPLAEHLGFYNKIDIALDTYPYHGTTTTCEALRMGVPVITLAGKTHVSRVGVSLLNGVGTPELIAFDPQQYVQIAANLANDLPRLNALHATLRQQMKNSSLMNGPDLARHVEQGYRKMWKDWCANPHDPI